MNPEIDASNVVTAEELRSLLASRLLQTPGQVAGTTLSFAQQRLWFLDQLESASPLYNVPCVLRLRGRLEVPALEQALNSILARHEILRARFLNQDGKAIQVIDPATSLQLQAIEVAALTEAEREAQMEQAVHEEITRPFDLGRERLLRAKLWRLAPEDHVLVVNMHHIISDEWSLKIFFRELSAFYRSLTQGETVRLPELPVQYADYAAWQQEWLQGENYTRQLEYWRQQLSGHAGAVELPMDHPRGAVTSHGGAIQMHFLGEELSQAIQELAKREGVTLFMLLMAAFQGLLYRYTQQEDIIVGTPVAGRNRMETEELIGLFVNTLPLRCKLSGNMTFQELLSQVREAALGGYSHQDMPFEKMVEALHPERALQQTPFFKVMFLTQNQLEPLDLPGLKAEFLCRPTGTAKFDVTLGVEETEHGLVAGIEYKTELYEAATIRQLLQHYESLLRGAVAQPTQRLCELPLLSDAERRQLLGRWQPRRSPSLRWPRIPQWFEAQVELTPEAAAVVLGATDASEGDGIESRREAAALGSLSYRELNNRANQLAHYLKRLGVGAETPVALCLERSVEMLVAILGVLKAEGAYLPIDPAYPEERKRFMLEDTGAPVLITQHSLRDALPAGQAKVVCLDTDWEEIAAESTANLTASAQADITAYIIYTSGSTGKPKGVLVTHHNVIRLFQETEHWYGFTSSDVWTLFHSYTFDFSVWEIWGALLYGGRLVVVPYLISRSPTEFYELLAHEEVTVLNQTPSAFRQLLWAEEMAPAPMPLKLRYVIFGGEALELQSLKPWFERHGDTRPRLVNMYGITETTVHVTYRPIQQVDLVSGAGSVIGVPIPDLGLYLLDEKLQPVPVGVPGEICVTGAGVARGYLNRPELTQQHFVPDPYSNQPEARMYRSGDLARFTASGELEYLGRMDHQVKIRGFRVELGEIESALNQHPAIRESLVMAADGPGGAKRLVAYFVPAGPASSTVELREYLGKRMPDYMVPGAFVKLEKLPLTANGKVDRRALPAVEASQTSSSTCTAPRNPTESTLVDIWRQLLGRTTVGIEENFFHLGGHSLLATQVISRIAGVLNVELPVRAIFESPTVAGLAETIGRAQPGRSGTIARRNRGSSSQELLSRLGNLSDSALEELLRNPKLKSGEQ